MSSKDIGMISMRLMHGASHKEMTPLASTGSLPHLPHTSSASSMGLGHIIEAEAVDSGSDDDTAFYGDKVGTPQFMAPEVRIWPPRSRCKTA